MRITVKQCTEWSGFFRSKINDPVERSLRVVQYGGTILAIAGFSPIAGRISRVRDLLFSTWIIHDLLQGLNGDAFQWIGKREAPSSCKEMRDLSFLTMDLFFPLVALTGLGERIPLLDTIVNVSWATGNGLELYCGDSPEMRTIAFFDLVHSATFLPYVSLPPAARNWTGLGAGVVFLGAKSWSLWPAKSNTD